MVEWFDWSRAVPWVGGSKLAKCKYLFGNEMGVGRMADLNGRKVSQSEFEIASIARELIDLYPSYDILLSALKQVDGFGVKWREVE